MSAQKPITHPITGAMIPRRNVFRRRTWDFLDGIPPVSTVWDVPSLAAGASATSSNISMPGVVFGTPLGVASSIALQGLTVTAVVQGADNVRITVANLTGGTVDLASATWTVYAVQGGRPSWIDVLNPGAGALQAPSNRRGVQQVITDAVLDSVAYIGTKMTFGVNGYETGANKATDAWHCVGLHAAGIRMGSTGTTPPDVNNTEFGIALSDLANTSGFTLRHIKGTAYAEIVVHGGSTIALDTDDVQAFEMLHNRTTKVGAMFDPQTKEAIIYTLDWRGDMTPLVVKSIPDVTVTAPIKPRVYVKATTATAKQLQIARLDLDVWT